MNLTSHITPLLFNRIVGLMAIFAGKLKAKMNYSGLIGTPMTSMDPLQEYIREHDQSELFIYDFECILIATNTFSDTNKLGEGGFGPVYKVIIFLYKIFRNGNVAVQQL